MNNTIRGEFDGIQESDRPEVIVIGDIGDAWTYDLMNELFHQVMDGAQIVALHRGRYWQVSNGLKLDIGAFVAGLEYATGAIATVVGKPSPEMFHAALRDLHLSPADVVMIGVPDARASSTMFGRPSTFPLSSRTEGMATMSAVVSQAATSSCERLPRKRTR